MGLGGLAILFLAGAAAAQPTASVTVSCPGPTDGYWCAAPVVNATSSGVFASVDASAVFAYPLDEGCFCGNLTDVHPDTTTYPTRNLTDTTAGHNLFSLFPSTWESGTLASSSIEVHQAVNASVTLTTEDATQGTSALRLQGELDPSTSFGYVRYRLSVGGLGAVPAGTPFTLSADHRLVSGDGTVTRLAMCWTNATESFISCDGTDHTPTSAWARGSHTASKPAGDVTGLRVYLRMSLPTPNTSGVLLLDRTQMEIGAAPTDFTARRPWVAGHYGWALSFNGLDDKLTIPDDPVLDQASYTVAYRAKTAYPLPLPGTAVSREGQFGLGYTKTAWAPNVTTTSGTFPLLVGAGTSLALPGDGLFHHYALTFDGAACGATAYLDGRAVAWRNLTAPCSSGDLASPVVVGRAFRGTLDDVRYHARALTPSEIAALAHPGAACEIDGVAVTCGSFPVTGDGHRRVYVNATGGGTTARANATLGVDATAPAANVASVCSDPGDNGWCRSTFHLPRFFYNESGNTVYETTFSSTPGSEWSLTERVNLAGNSILGNLGPGGVTLSLSSLPPHSNLTIETDLYIQESWDGSPPAKGPDVWRLSVDGGPTLLDTTFSNKIINNDQCYPSSCPATNNAGTGALGVPYPSPRRDVYRLSYTFAHTGSDVTFRFFSGQSQLESDESWALDNVRVLRDVAGLAPTSMSCKSGPSTVVDCFRNVTSQGTTLLYGNVSDVAGNKAFAWGSLKLDSVAPTVTSSVGGTAGSGGAFKSSATVTLSSSDATSGLTGSLEYRLNNGTWTAYTAPFALGEGHWWVEARHSDAAGNTGTTSRLVVVDLSPPTGSVAAYCALPGDGDWCRGPILQRFYANESGTTVYSNDFTAPAGTEWSSRPALDVGADRALGAFGRNAPTTLTLTGLPAHQSLTLEFDLWIIRSWDGNNATNGPDLFAVKADGADILNTSFADSTFGSGTFPQCYPSSCPATNVPGAGRLGGTQFGGTNHDLYRVSLTFLHKASTVALRFDGYITSALSDESFALDNVRVLRDVTGLDRASVECKSGATTARCFRNVTTEGTSALFGNVSDATGHTASAYGVHKLDSVAPAITADLGSSGLGLGGAYTLPVHVTLAASDATSGLFGGLDYRISNGSWTTYGAPFTLGEGTWFLEAYQRDVAGNTGMLAREVKVDLTHPTISIQPSGANASGWYGAETTISIAASEPMSRLMYRLNGGAEMPYVGPIAISVAGNHTIEAWGEDLAGNPQLPNAGSTAVSQIEMGFFFSCARNATGTVDCWGSGPSVGYAYDDRTTPDVVQVSGGNTHTCYLLTNQSVECVGTETGGGRTDDRYANDAVSISAGRGHNCAVLVSANVACWGTNTSGKASAYLGGDALAVGAGESMTCILRTNKNVFCQGPADARTAGYAGGDAASLSVGEWHSCVVRESGNVACWGFDDYGQLAPYTAGDAEQVSAGAWHTCALRQDRNVTCWGRNQVGQAAPYMGGDAIAVSAGGNHTCALLLSSRIECWGSDVSFNSDVRVGQSFDWSPSVRAAFSVDATPPTTALSLAGTTGDAGWLTSNATVWLNATDAQAGVASVRFQTDNGTEQTYAGPFVLAQSASIRYWAVDGVGNAEAPRDHRVRIDAVAPTSVAALSGTLDDGWYVSPVNVALSATDATSGVASIRYSLDGAAEQEYGSAFTVHGSGAHVVTYHALDAAGNAEPTRNVTFSIDTTAPTTTLDLNATEGQNGWYVSPVTVTLGAADAGAGVSEIRYRINEGAAQTYGGPFVLTATTSLTFWAVDELGHAETPRERTIPIDLAAPTTTASPSGTPGEDGWFRSGVNVALGATDAASGVARVRYAVDGGAESDYAGAFLVSGQGAHVVLYRAIDVAGNVEAQRQLGLSIDSVAPVTTAAYEGTLGENGRYVSNVTVTLGATDATAGVDAIETRFPGGGWQPYLAPLELTQTTTFEARATDAAGNVEAAQNLTVRIDRDAPVASLAASCATPGDNGWCRGAVTLAASASDGDSDVASMACALDGVAFDCAASFDATSDGHHNATLTVTDLAGRVSSASASFRIDATAPTGALGLSGDEGVDGWFVGDVRATLAASDATSPVSTRYRVDNGSVVAGAAFVDVAAEGLRYVEAWAQDEAGNVGATEARGVKIDKTDPASALAVPAPDGNAGWHRSAPTLTLTGTDATSGVAQLRYRLDNGSAATYSAPFALDVSGRRWVEHWAVDAAGRAGAPAGAEVRVDLLAPNVTIATTCATPGNDSWCRGGFSFTPSATDVHSGIASAACALDGASVPCAPRAVDAEGQHEATMTATDVAGNGASATAPFRVDRTPPTASVSVSCDLPTINGICRGNLTFTPSSSDAVSGVGSTSCHLNGVSVACASTKVEGDGRHVFRLNVTDVAGHTREAEATGLIDKVGPTVAILVACASQGANGWCLAPANVTFSAHEAGQPPDSVTCSRNGAALPSCDPLDVGEGTTRLSITASDAAGNTASAEASANVDLTAPAATITPSCANPGNAGWCRSGSFSYAGSSQDGASGVPPGQPRCTADGLSSPSCSGALTGQGPHRVTIQTADRAGRTNAATLDLAIDNVAPSVWANWTCSAPLSDNWCPGTVSVVTDARDATSGVAGWTCALNAAPVECPAFGATSDGQHTGTAVATDRAGNAATANAAFRIDATPPVAALATSCSLPGDDGWCRGSVTLVPTASDSTSGVRETVCRVDGAARPCTDTMTSPGTRMGVVEVRDRAGHLATASRGFSIDAVAPSAWANWTCAEPGAGGYCLGDVTLGGEASDAHSGLRTLSCYVGDAPVGCAAAFGADGVHVLRVEARDVAGNVKSATSTFRIDRGGPELSLSVACSAPGTNDWCKGVVTVATAAFDNASGVSSTACRLDGATVACGSIVVPSQGPHVVELTASDTAGRTTTATSTFRIDSIAPTPFLNATCAAPGLSGWCRGALSLVGTASDATAGVAALSCTLDGAAAPCAGFGTALDGHHNATLAVIDAAGNTADASLAFRIDAQAPQVLVDHQCAAPGDEGWCRGSVRAEQTAADAMSGIRRRSCRVDGAVANCANLTVLPQGHHNVTVEAEDVAGNVATAITSFRIDTGEPSIDPRIVCAIRSNPSWCRAPSFSYGAFVTETISGLAVGPVCTVNGAPDGDCQETLSGEATHSIEIYARDRAGNERTVVASVTIDSATPTLVDATPGPKAGQVTLGWTAPTTQTPITGYRIHHATKPTGPFTAATLVGNELAGVDLGLAAGTVYFFRVTAFSEEAGESAPSNVLSARTFSLPAAPQNLTATGGSGRVVITWDPPADDGGAPVTSYRIFRGTFENGTKLRAEVDGDTFRFNEPAADPNETPTGRVFYRILAVNAAGAGAYTPEVNHSTTGVAAPNELRRVDDRPRPESAGSSAVPFNETWRRLGFGSAGEQDAARVMAMHPAGSVVYVAGATRIAGETDIAIVAYDAVTGLERWSRVERRSGFDRPTGIAVDPFGQRVYVTGQADADYLTVAYDAGTGQLVWLHEHGALATVEGATAITATYDGILVLVTGQVSGGSTQGDIATFALDAVDGRPVTGGAPFALFATPADDRPVSLHADQDGRRFFVTATSGDDIVTIGHDVATGAQLWLKRYDNGGKDLAVGGALSQDGLRVYAAGTSAGAGGMDYVTLAYNSTTGAALWTARMDASAAPMRTDDVARGLALSPDGLRLYVTGRSGASTLTGSDVTTVAYDTTTGVELWRNVVDASRDDDASGIAIAPDSARVYVVGRSWNGTQFDVRVVFHEATTGLAVVNHTFLFGGLGHDSAAAVVAAPGPDRNVHVHVAGEWGGPAGASSFALVSYAPILRSGGEGDGSSNEAQARVAVMEALEGLDRIVAPAHENEKTLDLVKT